MRANEFIKDDTINRNPASKQWQVRADDDMALKYETPETILKDTSVVVEPDKKIFAYIQGTPVKSFDPTGFESFPIRFKRDPDSPFYRSDTDEPINHCDYVEFNSDGSVIGYSSQFEDTELDEMAGKIHGGIRNVLQDKGYKYLGSGIDKQAWLEPKSGQVLIIFGYRKDFNDFTPDQRMFINWINYCNQHQDNPALPKFSGFESFEYRGKKYIQARMEPLQELSYKIKEIVGYIENIVDNVGNGDVDYALQTLADEGYYNYEENKYTPYKLERLLELLGGKEKAQNLLNTVHAVAVFGTNQRYHLDLHSGNYMTRPNGEIVVNDPFVIWLNES